MGFCSTLSTFLRGKNKGFKTNPLNEEALTGEFNGSKVNVYVATNNDKVWRIMVCEKNLVGETDIKIRFNNLCNQFLNNKKYIPAIISSDYAIPEDEDIGYEITVNDKRYEAAFYQFDSTKFDTTKIDTAAMTNMAEELLPIISEKYTAEQLANPTKEMQKEMMPILLKYIYGSSSKRLVWFMISNYYGQYYITMFYDNEYNRSNGEEL